MILFVTHKKILEKLKELCPSLDVKMWWKKGDHSIRVRAKDQDFIFTYYSEYNWRLETLHYFENMNGE
jgi:hypothetical protein